MAATGYLGAKPFPGFGRAEAESHQDDSTAAEDEHAPEDPTLEDDDPALGSDAPPEQEDVVFDDGPLLGDDPVEGQEAAEGGGAPEADDTQAALDRLQQEFEQTEVDFYREEQELDEILDTFEEAAEAFACESEAGVPGGTELSRLDLLLREAEQREQREEEERRLIEFERLAEEAAELRRMADEAATPEEAAALLEQAKNLADKQPSAVPAPQAAVEDPVDVEALATEDAGGQDSAVAGASGFDEPSEKEQELRGRYLQLLEQAAVQRAALQATLDEIQGLEQELGLHEDAAAADEGIDIQGLYRPAKKPKRAAAPKPALTEAAPGDEADAAQDP